MKITSTSPLTQPVPTTTGGRSAENGEAASRASTVDKVSLSAHANFVAEMREQAGPPEFRQDVVDQVKAQLANGTFEASIDTGRMLDGLLGAL